VYLEILLGFVDNLAFMFGRHEQIQLQWEIAKGVKVASTKLFCLQYLVFHKVWVLAMHGFSLLDCPQPIGHDTPHREEIWCELIHQRPIE
jgi:hypothetical protein